MRIPFSFARKYIFHILLWTLVIISLAIDANELYSLSKGLFSFYVITKTAVLLALVYLNLLLFYPLFYKKRRYLLYILYIISITLIACYLNTKLELFVRENRGLDNGPNYFIFFVKQFFMAVRYVLTSFFLQITVDYYEQKETIKKIELEKTIAELNFLKAQVNPHFLFNTLNNLYALIIEKSDKSGECVLKLADILKYILAEGREDKVSLKKELLLLENYIELERLRKPDADVSFTTECNINNYQITPLILLPFVENAFKHGLNTVTKNGFIHLNIKAQDQFLTLSIENNIPPAGNAVAVQSHGIGIENVKKRLELVYPNRYKLLIERKNNSFLVNLQLQLA
jgi:two-component system, LytTR family, sensor kinase